MDEKKNAYLSVKDIARIKSKHEETIRRWISANKIEVPKFNSKKKGYSIPVDSLVQSGILTEDEVERFLHSDSNDPRGSLPDWQALLKEHEGAVGEELLQLITALTQMSQEYSRRKMRLTEQILALQNQLAGLEYEAASLENESRQISDHLTYLRSRL